MDGEAYVGLTRQIHNGREHFQAVVNVGQVSCIPLDELRRLFGGSISVVSDQFGQHYQWRVYGATAASTLQRVLPFLVVKRRQAVLVLEYQETVVVGARPRITDAVQAHRAAIYAALLELNKRRTRKHAERLSEEAPPAREDGAIVRSHGNEKL